MQCHGLFFWKTVTVIKGQLFFYFTNEIGIQF